MQDTLIQSTPNDCALPRRRADFATFNEAIDYAARSEKGLNFHDMRGTLERAYPYREMREDALAMAHRLVAAGIRPKDRVALIAETCPEFAALFCACVYAGAWPVPLPLPTTFGGKESYIDQLVVQLESSDPALLIYPPEIAEMTQAAAQRVGCKSIDWDTLAAQDAPGADLPEAAPDDICYLQYSSGSTRFPTGVAVTHKALLHNLYGHAQAMDLGTNDRCVSWLPWYHDMGLVGCFLSLIANQVSADYLKTEHFARRPLAWLDLISRNPGATLSYSPTFGYDICARRISSQSQVADRFDLRRDIRFETRVAQAAWDDAAGRVGGAVEDHQLCFRGNQAQHFLGVEGKARVFVKRHRHGLGAGEVDRRFIDRETGVGIEDLGPRFAEHQDGGKHGDLAAGHDQHRIGADLGLETAVQVAGHRLAQGADAGGVGIAVLPIAQRLDRRLDDVFRRREVRLADAQVERYHEPEVHGVDTGRLDQRHHDGHHENDRSGRVEEEADHELGIILIGDREVDCDLGQGREQGKCAKRLIAR